MTVPSQQLQHLQGMLEYAEYIVKPPQPVFNLNEYKKKEGLVCKDSDIIPLQQSGVKLYPADEIHDDIWLAIPRVKKEKAPDAPEILRDWVTVKDDPNTVPKLAPTIIQTCTPEEAKSLQKAGKIRPEDSKASVRAAYLRDVTLRSENVPIIRSTFTKYEQQWQRWADKERPRRKIAELYRQLFNFQQKLEQESNQELIWGVGMLHWRYERREISIPLLEKSMELDINESTGEILLRPTLQPVRLIQGPFVALELKGITQLDNYAKPLMAELAAEFVPMDVAGYADILRQAATFLDSEGRYWPEEKADMQDASWPELSNLLTVTDNWVLYTRERKSLSEQQDIQKFKALIGQDDTPALSPLLQQFISPPSDTTAAETAAYTGSDAGVTGDRASSGIEDLYFPKPYNKAQESIVQRLEQQDAVVVQGPPGTGKTHTIANIICHYLAEGRRVLVTSQKESALAVLREQIPDDLRPLAVSLLTNERAGQKQLEQTVHHIDTVISKAERSELEQQIATLSQRVEQIKHSMRGIEKEMGQLAKQQLQPIPETLRKPELRALEPAKLNTQADKLTATTLAQEVKAKESAYAWLPDALDFSTEYEAQFSSEDIQLLRKLRQALGNYLPHMAQAVPDLSTLPTVKRVQQLHRALLRRDTLASTIKAKEMVLLEAEALANFTVEDAKKLVQDMQHCQQMVAAEPALEALYRDILAGTLAKEVKECLAGLGKMVEKRQKYAKAIDVQDPQDNRDKIKEALDKLCEGKSPFARFRLGANPVKNYIESITLQGRAPTSPQQWREVRDFIGFQEQARSLYQRWDFVARESALPPLRFDYGATHKNYQATYEQIQKLRRVAQRWQAISPLAQRVFGQHYQHTLPLDNAAMAYFLETLDLNQKYAQTDVFQQEIVEQQNYLANIDAKIARALHNVLRHVGQPKITEETLRKEWQKRLRSLQMLHKGQRHWQRLKAITAKISASGAPKWAHQLETHVYQDKERLLPEDSLELWRLLRARSYLEHISAESLKQLNADYLQADKDLKKTFIELIQHKAHLGLKNNLSPKVSSALKRVVQALNKVGKGTGKGAARHKRAAQQAMEACVEGVPCWIMPVARISENLPSQLASFDLVIIDEASQSDIKALSAILRAKKLLIVGDDKQVSPTFIVSEENVEQVKHNFLQKHPFAEQLLPPYSIYDLAKVVFPQHNIVLTEHFRCVEPIIRFSMNNFYESQGLQPLRLPKASERLDPPLIDVYVPLGARGERGNKKAINQEEVEGIVTEIKTITAEPTYQGRSIGVISLIGDKQAKAIQDKLLTELGEETFRKFNIACGDAATFQGRERDIIFLSLVASPNNGIAMTKQEYQQRFNVAFSRARDRMYLYRSITMEHLSRPDDMRLKALQHFDHPMPDREEVENLLELCDSGFERDVFQRLVDKGYKVIPQVKVGKYSIDLVVEDGDARLAIELDGEKYHPPEQWHADWQRQRDMERVGWDFWRCWGSDYYHDPEGCIADLVSELAKKGIEPVHEEGKPSRYVEKREYRSEVGYSMDEPSNKDRDEDRNEDSTL